MTEWEEDIHIYTPLWRQETSNQKFTNFICWPLMCSKNHMRHMQICVSDVWVLICCSHFLMELCIYLFWINLSLHFPPWKHQLTSQKYSFDLGLIWWSLSFVSIMLTVLNFFISSFVSKRAFFPKYIKIEKVVTKHFVYLFFLLNFYMAYFHSTL